ncbi:aldose-1-epimerase [Kluyvera genomosp. 1]|uniref:aldose-1-epimerase n=1 Tax=Kluyvera genomosp. 1 TaxID=2774053 RepID=UPI000691A9FC|nr:aldose-1-epimerase [Kluyvera genomosp. 1]
MHKSGSTVALNAGDYQAKIVTVGAGMASLTHRGRHVVIPHRPEEMPLAHLGKVLIPWPNRITDGSYQHDGKTLQPAINDRAGNTAIHGLLAWVNWQIVEQSPTSVTLSAFLPPSYGYPFMLSSEVTYQLSEETGLSARILTQNIGDVTAPYGAGVHPYLTCNLHSVDECELRLPTNQLFDVATSTLATTHALDFQTQRRIAATQIDHTFTVPKCATPWQVTLAHPELTVWLRSNQLWLQVYSGEKLDRKGLAVEPMSCPPDAFNSGIDVVQLKPGEAHLLWFAIGGE